MRGSKKNKAVKAAKNKAVEVEGDAVMVEPKAVKGDCPTCGNQKGTLCRLVSKPGGKAYGPQDPANCGRYKKV